MISVTVCPAQDKLLVQLVHKPHKKKCDQNTAARTHGTSHGSVDRLRCFILSGNSFDQQIGSSKTDHCI